MSLTFILMFIYCGSSLNVACRFKLQSIRRKVLKLNTAVKITKNIYSLSVKDLKSIIVSLTFYYLKGDFDF